MPSEPVLQKTRAILTEKPGGAVGGRLYLKLIVERASQAPISNMMPIKANHTRVATDK